MSSLSRLLFAGVCALIIGGQPIVSEAAAPCMTAAVKTAFDVSALKSDLMVTALLCHQQATYDADITKYRRNIAAQEGILDGWFSRTYGSSASYRREDYITQLANARSQYAMNKGDAFCSAHASTLTDVSNIKTNAAMEAYAAQQNYDQPLQVAACSIHAHWIRRMRAADSVHRTRTTAVITPTTTGTHPMMSPVHSPA